MNSGVLRPSGGISNQFCDSTYPTPNTITKTTTPSFRSTKAVFDAALSRMPMTRIPVHKPRISTAGKFNHAPGVENGSFDNSGGTGGRCSTLSRALKYLVHEAATVAALIAYSRIRSQPMIQAKISPSVAYA